MLIANDQVNTKEDTLMASSLPFSARNVMYQSLSGYPWISWGGEWVVQSGSKPNGNLNIEADNIEYLANELTLGINIRATEQFGVFVDLEWQQAFVSTTSKNNSQLSMKSANFIWFEDHDLFNLRLGRQYYEDNRGFLFHDSLDGLHGEWTFHVEAWQWQLQFALAKQAWLPINLLDVVYNTGADYHFVQLVTNHGDHQGAGYLLNRYQQNINADTISEQLLLLGFRGQGHLASSISNQGVGYWYEIAYASGRHRGVEASRDIDGIGFDVGVLLPLDPMLKPLALSWLNGNDHRFIVSYAHGSGDTNSQHQDQRFRQTGLQLNTGWLGEGGAKLKYYGEIVKPELSNINIATLGLRLRPSSDSSIELLWHEYRQDQPATTFYGYGIKRAPNGLDTRLGQEVDLIVSYRHINNLVLELDLGWFQPGAAFSGTNANMFMAYAEMRYFF
ncbi:alginate export family protein [Shewanella sp. NIFS-20-20]|uniref:alginate export family protein n=1 Tax=Shewanella sp. NIFS-20-20 TaxID=2853806 RepID=UPI001C46BA23|nr:alginate export family protein [Shewanella sp. NIFS-20-20]MBV7315111.1 alginate export family protein [Shewanella sp. NIFS-20-20]